MSLNPQLIFRFGAFRLDVRERRLERDGIPLSIGPKVMDTLVLLVENAGNLVARSTMRERLWPGQIVEDGTLARTIADLRKALGDVDEDRRYIETVPKFGYRFVARVEKELAEPPILESNVPFVQERIPHLHSGRTPSNNWLWSIAAVLLLAGAWLAIGRMRSQQQPIPSLLITPFQMIGDAADAAMLPLGLEDSLTMELSGLSHLAVIEFKPQGEPLLSDVAELGRRHRTEFVLAGTIQLASGRIHLNARLLRSATGEAVWTRTLDENRDDVLIVESRLAKLTVSQLIPALPADEGERMARKLPSNALAYRDYLLGRHYWNKRDANAYIQAIDMFKQAAEADPRYAPAYVGLADSYLLAAGFRRDPLTEALPLAQAAIDKAIQLDPSLGEAHATLALIAGNYYFNWEKAEQELQTATHLAPNYVTAHHWYAEFLTMMGKFKESEAEFEVARNLDPASPIVLTDLAQLYNFEKNYRRSVSALDDVLKLDSTFHLAHNRKGIALMMMQRPKEALMEFETANQAAGRPGWIGEKAWAAAVGGKRSEAMEFARQAERDNPNPYVLSVIWAELGEADRAMDWLQKAYDSRSPGLTSLKVNPIFDRLRSCGRFRALLRQMNLS